MNELNSQSEPSKEGAGSACLLARRHFVRGAGVAIPTVLSVGSRSALANGCLSPSASASINLTQSRPNRNDGSCALGRTPGYWQNASTTHPAEWAQCGAEGKKFSVCFLSGFGQKTLEEVMNLNGGQDPEQLGAHLCAAWCNLQMKWVDESVISLEVLRAMWAGQNSYHPLAGVTWSRQDTVNYLKTTMHL